MCDGAPLACDNTRFQLVHATYFTREVFVIVIVMRKLQHQD